MHIPEVAPMLMFEGRAEEAMSLYVELFGGEVIAVARHGAQAPGAEGTIAQAGFTIRGQTLLCMDSPIEHAFTFTPSISLFVTCETEDDLRRIADALLDGGEALMPLDNYGFSRLFVWLNDRFGVSWQLNLS